METKIEPGPGLLEFTDPDTGATWTYYGNALLDGTTITDTTTDGTTIRDDLTGGGNIFTTPIWGTHQPFQYQAEYDQGGYYTTIQQEALELIRQKAEKIQKEKEGKDKFIKELQGVYIQAW